MPIDDDGATNPLDVVIFGLIGLVVWLLIVSFLPAGTVPALVPTGATPTSPAPFLTAGGGK